MTVISIADYKQAGAAQADEFPAGGGNARLLAMQFEECYKLLVAGAISHLSASRLADKIVADHLAGSGARPDSRQDRYVLSLIAEIRRLRCREQSISGTARAGGPGLDMLELRLRLEVPPDAACTEEMLRAVTTHDGSPCRVEQFVAFGKSAACACLHWNELISLASLKGGRHRGVAGRLRMAMAALAIESEPALFMRRRIVA